MSETSSPDLELTAEIVSAYVSKNPVPVSDLPDLIASVAATLQGIVLVPPASSPVEAQKPAVPIKKSITPDYIVSLEDGQKFKSLKRALSTRYGMTPEEYRTKWGIAPRLSYGRSQLRCSEVGDG